MALIKSISGIRGTIGGKPGETLSPLDVVRFTAAFGTWLSQQSTNKKIVIGRDGRISGEMVQRIVVSTLNALGFDVVDLGLSTTPTVEMAVTFENAAGGIILTASHNPKEWNALKLLNGKGEFISGDDGAKVLAIAEADDFNFVTVDKFKNTIKIPKVFAEVDSATYLCGQTINKLFKSEEIATELALNKMGRPTCAIRIPKVSEETVGALLYMLEAQTAYIGELLDINAFDQPGVELGKDFAYGMMGKKGYEAKKKEVENSPKQNTDVVIKS